MKSNFFRRRRLIVDRFQYRFVAISAAHFGLVLVVFLIALFLPLMLRLDDPSVTWIEKRQIADVILFFNDEMWLPLGAVFLLLTVHSLFVSHRICGPLYRFRAVFKAVAAGDLGARANLRKHDYLHADARALNEMIVALEARFKSLVDQGGLLEEEAARLKETMKSGAKAETQKILERVESQVRELHGGLTYFTHKP